MPTLLARGKTATGTPPLRPIVLGLQVYTVPTILALAAYKEMVPAGDKYTLALDPKL